MCSFKKKKKKNLNSAMDRAQLLLVGLPLFLLCSDLFSLFTSSPPPPKPSHHHHHHHQQPVINPVTTPFPSDSEVIFYSFNQFTSSLLYFHHHNMSNYYSVFVWSQKLATNIGGAGFGNTVNINFCSSCSYKYVIYFRKYLLYLYIFRNYIKDKIDALFFFYLCIYNAKCYAGC